MDTDLNNFVNLYDGLGVDFAHQELGNSQYLIFLPNDAILFTKEDRAPYIQFDLEGNFMRQQL